MADLLFREREISTLRRLIRADKRCFVRGIHVYGPPATGKTTIVRDILHSTIHAYVDCREINRDRAICHSIGSQLRESKSSRERKCFTLVDLASTLSKEHALKVGTGYIVLDGVDELCEVNPAFLTGLLRLPEASQCNICLIIISSNRKTLPGCWKPSNFFTVRFPTYTVTELANLAEAKVRSPVELKTSVWKKMLRFVFEGISHATSSLRRCVLIAKMIKPVAKSLVKKDGVTLELATIKALVRRVCDLMPTDSLTASVLQDFMSHCQSTDIGSTQSLILQLPIVAKYVLLASFLAAHNPPKSDAQMFSAEAGPRKKRRRTKKVSKEISTLLTGPKPF
eukprot:938070-Amorphochlora_amoeboformis.AAC.1